MIAALRFTRRSLRLAVARFALLAAFAALPLAHAGYRVENIARPVEMRGGISAVGFTPTGTLVVATRFGEIWMRSSTGAWHCFARGLNEPMGFVIDSEKILYVAHRPELLKLTDTDGDGRADTFAALGGQWGISHNYHEFFFGLRRDPAGNFLGVISLTSNGDKLTVPPDEVRGTLDPAPLLQPTGQYSDLPLRGWAVKIAPDGKLTPIASGFRQANGIGLSPDGDFFVNENQGDYKPSCGLLHVAPGDFHGHVASLKWEPGFDAKNFTTEHAWRRYKSPAVVFPHGPMGISGGEPVWDLTKGKFGPYAGQVFAGDYSRLVVRSSLQKVAGEWQGVCFPFLGRNETPAYTTGEKLLSGITRSVFAPDGSLYLGATGGWGAGADGLQRIVWDGEVAAEVLDVKLTDRGFALTFTRPMDAATLTRLTNFEINRFRYYYQFKYGSPWIDEARVRVNEVRPGADGLSAELIVSELRPGFIYELSVPALRTRDHQPLANPLAYYTANRLLNGEKTIGGTTRLPRPGEISGGAKDEVALTNVSAAALVTAGEKTYRLYCVACHQPDGRGIPGGAANFREDKTRLAKPDAALLKIIAEGNELKGMPAFDAMVTGAQRRAVLAYIRATFGAQNPEN
ncbi:MAG: c-type cytochrome [Undibacterium sp.]|nr:c-type cytochrome [Opitutaceae bacterium]